MYTPLLQVALSSSPQSEGRLTETNKDTLISCTLFICVRDKRMNNLETRETLDTRHGMEANKRRRRKKCDMDYMSVKLTSTSMIS